MGAQNNISWSSANKGDVIGDNLSRLVLKSRCVFKRSKVLLLKTLQLFRTSLERLSPKSNFFICGAPTNIIFCSHFVLWSFRYFVPIHCNVPIKTINAFRSDQFKKWEWQHQKRRIWYKALVPSHQRKWQFENKFRSPIFFLNILNVHEFSKFTPLSLDTPETLLVSNFASHLLLRCTNSMPPWMGHQIALLCPPSIQLEYLS